MYGSEKPKSSVSLPACYCSCERDVCRVYFAYRQIHVFVTVIDISSTRVVSEMQDLKMQIVDITHNDVMYVSFHLSFYHYRKYHFDLVLFKIFLYFEIHMNTSFNILPGIVTFFR